MWKVIDVNDYKVTQYALETLEDVNTLPKKGITTTSTAICPNGGDMKVFIFTENTNPDGTGTWDPMQ